MRIPTTGNQRRKLGRKLGIESLETRRLLAVLFSENFDPIQPSNFESIIGGRVFGASLPLEYHSGDTLYFDSSGHREAITGPISITSGTLSFRLRLGAGFYPFEDIDQISEQVVVEYSTSIDNTWKVLKEYSRNESSFNGADVWDLATFTLPADASSNQTRFRWRQASNSGAEFDNWGIDDILVEGVANVKFDVGAAVRSTPVESAELSFPLPIDANSLSLSNFKLTKNGASIPLPSTALIQQKSAVRFSVSGLANANQDDGLYRLELDLQSVVALNGTNLSGKVAVAWTLDQTPPRAVDVIDVSPDPRTGTGKAVDNIDIVFSEQIDLTSLTSDDLVLTRDGGANVLDNSVTIATLNGNSVRVGNLAQFTNQSGRYVFSINGQYKDLAGNVGTTVRKDEWIANDAPVVVVGEFLVFPEGSAPRLIAAGGIVTDVDSPVLNGGKLTVTLANPTPQDQLGISSSPQSITQLTVVGQSVLFQRVVIGVFAGGVNGAPLTVDLNARATIAAVQALLRSINYQYVGEILKASSQNIFISLTDGEGGTSRTKTKEALRRPVNDAPTLTVTTKSFSYSLNAPAIAIAATATIKDVDSPNFYNGALIVRFASGSDGKEQLGVKGDYSIANDQLFYKGNLIGIVNSDGQNGRVLSLKLNEKATIAVVQGLARSLTFSTLNSTSTALRSLEFFVQDGGGGGQSAITKLSIKPK